MVIALFGEFPDPTTALSYFSKKEDIDKVNIVYVICYKTSFHLYQLYFSFWSWKNYVINKLDLITYLFLREKKNKSVGTFNLVTK